MELVIKGKKKIVEVAQQHYPIKIKYRISNTYVFDIEDDSDECEEIASEISTTLKLKAFCR